MVIHDLIHEHSKEDLATAVDKIALYIQIVQSILQREKNDCPFMLKYQPIDFSEILLSSSLWLVSAYWWANALKIKSVSFTCHLPQKVLELHYDGPIMSWFVWKLISTWKASLGSVGFYWNIIYLAKRH